MHKIIKTSGLIYDIVKLEFYNHVRLEILKFKNKNKINSHCKYQDLFKMWKDRECELKIFMHQKYRSSSNEGNEYHHEIAFSYNIYL